MTHHPIHILHLTAQWLRWVTIQPGAAPQVTDSGTIAEAPERALDQWAARQRDPRSRIVLYDGRPIYYNFSLTLPAEALKQRDRILRLKLAQEVGMGDDSVFWTASIEPRRDTPGQSDVYMVVARREALEDIISWRQRHDLNNLWVGADLCAIRTLLAQSATPLVILNTDEQGVTLYHANGLRQILKERADKHAAPRPDMGWAGASGRVHFGGSSPNGLFDRYPALGTLQLVANGQLQRGGGGTRLGHLTPQILEFDAVLLGGILDHAAGHPPTQDLIREITPQPLEIVLRKFTLKRLIVITVACALVLGYTAWKTGTSRAGAQAQLAAQARLIEPGVRQLQVQETILRSIKSARKPMMPVFEAIHKAAPQGITLKSLNVGDTGGIKIMGQTQAPDAPNQFARDLGQSPLLDRVELNNAAQDPKTRIVTFQIEAHAKGSGK